MDHFESSKLMWYGSLNWHGPLLNLCPTVSLPSHYPPSFPLAALTALGLRRACPSQYSLISVTTPHHRNGSHCYLCITITNTPVQDMLSQPLCKAPGFISSWKYRLIMPYDSRTPLMLLSWRKEHYQTQRLLGMLSCGVLWLQRYRLFHS